MFGDLKIILLLRQHELCRLTECITDHDQQVSKHADLNTFLNNTQKAIKKVPLQRLNDAVVSCLQNPAGEMAKIDRVFAVVGEEYSIPVRKIKKSTSRNANAARKMAYCLFHFDLGLTTRYIATDIFGKWQTSVAVVIKRFRLLDDKIKHEREFLDTYKRLQLKIQ